MRPIPATAPSFLSPSEKRLFEEEGYLGPFSLWPASHVPRVTQDLRSAFARVHGRVSLNPEQRWLRLLRFIPGLRRQYSEVGWYKGAHAVSREVFEVGNDPSIVDRVESVLGPDVLLWGSILIDKPPGEHHPWHADVEHVTWEGVTVWIGLDGVTPLSSISVITRSHRFARYPQQLKRSNGLNASVDKEVLAAAQQFDLSARLLHLDLKPGEWILFAGRTWHAARNLTESMRTSLVFQYSPSTARVKVPLTYEPPLRWHACQPPCCLLRGNHPQGRNLVVPAPER